MVLDIIRDPKRAEKKPYKMFFIGLIYSSIAILISLWIFQGYGSILVVVLTMLGCTLLMYNIIKYEETKDIKIKKESFLLKQHSKALLFFVFLFLGFMVSFAAWFIFLPEEKATYMFELQIDTINDINNRATGSAVSTIDDVNGLFFANLRVLSIALFFSIVYGLGAMFILTWNASVLGTAIGTLIRNNLAELSVVKTSSFLGIFSLAVLRYSIHGIPEMSAYFIAALAGGIISIAVIKHDLFTKNFKKIVIDSLDLVLVAIGILYIAAILEVFISPII